MRETKPPRLELATSRFARRMQWNARRNPERRANPPKAPATTRARPLKSGRRRSRPLREGRTAREPIGEAAAISYRKGTSGLPNLASLSAEQAHRRRTQPKKHAAAQRSRPLKRGGADGRRAAYGRRVAAEKPFRRKKLCSSQKASFTTGVFAAGISPRRHRDTNASCRKQAIGMQPAKGMQQQSTRLGAKAAGMQPAGSRKIRRRATDRRLHQTDGFTTCGSPARHRRFGQPPTSGGQRSAPSTMRMSSCCVWTSSLR